MVSLKNVQFTLDGNGGIDIQGKFGKSRFAEDAGHGIVEQYLKEMAEAKPDEFEQSLFKRASEELIEDHDDEWGDVGRHPHQSKVLFKDGKISTYVSSPEAEAELEEEIRVEVNAMLEDEGIRLDEALEIAVDEKGTIRAVNLSPQHPDAEKVELLLDSLSRMIKIEGNKPVAQSTNPAGREEGVAGTAKRLAPHMRHLAAHRPDGDAWFVKQRRPIVGLDKTV